MTPYSCIIFDMDGTLTSTTRLIFDSFNHIVVREGRKPLSDEAIIGLFGPPEEGALEKIVGQERVDEAMKEYLRFYEDHHSSRAGIHEGIDELLKKLREAGKKLALFTGKGQHTTRISLDQLGLGRMFDVIVTGNDVEHHKPSGEGIMKVMSETGSERHETLMIGDSVADLRAAREAGVAIASVLWDAHSPETVLAMNPDFVFRDVGSLTAWLCT